MRPSGANVKAAGKFRPVTTGVALMVARPVWAPVAAGRAGLPPALEPQVNPATSTPAIAAARAIRRLIPSPANEPQSIRPFGDTGRATGCILPEAPESRI